MLTEQDLNELIAYRPDDLVLSVYLNVDPKSGAADVYKLRLRQMLKDLDGAVAEDSESVQRYIEHEYDWSGRSLALFSCARERFLKTFTLQVPVRDRARVLHRPYVKPLADMMDHFGNYGIALVDQQSARLFHFHLGILREEDTTLSETIRRTKVGGTQVPGGRVGAGIQTRSIEEFVERNLKEAAQFAARFFKANRVRRVLVGGTEENVARFIEFLPKMWRSLVVGTFPINMSAGHMEIQRRAMEVGQRAERQREVRLVETMITSAAKGKAGVLGLDQTLGMVHEGRVQTLIIAEGYRAPGYRCKGCRYTSGFELKACPFCGDEFETIPDAVEVAVRTVMQRGGEIEVIRGNPELAKAGNIGALLRY